MKELKVELSERSYNIKIENNLLGDLSSYIKEFYFGQKVVIVTDSNVDSLYGSKLSDVLTVGGFTVNKIVIPAGEENKNHNTLMDIYKKLISFSTNRKDLIIAFGGGVVGDITGFAASTFMRGVDFIQIPTTLLAMVDSSVGGKVAVDLPEGKNLVGAFYQPKAVFIDPALLGTLSDEFFYDGMAEVIKYGCIKDKNLFDLLNTLNTREEVTNNIIDIIYTCCNIKRLIVEQDELDLGDRMLLNFGHTIGHAIEKYFNFDTYSHGVAVAMGMSMITYTSEKLGKTEKNTSKSLDNLLIKYNLSTLTPNMDIMKLAEIITHDKKSESGFINLILLKQIGCAFIQKEDNENLANYLDLRGVC